MPLRAEQIVLTPTRYGRMLHLANDLFVGRSFREYGEFSEGEVDLFRQMLRPGMLVCDVGANIGAHTIPFAQLVGNTGAVVAFEPIPFLFQLLSGNVALNACTNVRTFPYAVGAEAGVVRIPPIDFGREENYGGLSVDQFAFGEPVPVVALDDLTLPRADFLKVDVEGMERLVLLGARQLIKRCAPVLYVENNRNEKAEALLACIEGLGYEAYWHITMLYNPGNLRANKVNVFEETASFNMLCVPAGFPVAGLDRVTLANCR